MLVSKKIRHVWGSHQRLTAKLEETEEVQSCKALLHIDNSCWLPWKLQALSLSGSHSPHFRATLQAFMWKKWGRGEPLSFCHATSLDPIKISISWVVKWFQVAFLTFCKPFLLIPASLSYTSTTQSCIDQPSLSCISLQSSQVPWNPWPLVPANYHLLLLLQFTSLPHTSLPPISYLLDSFQLSFPNPDNKSYHNGLNV